jgi:hypothetical protein
MARYFKFIVHSAQFIVLLLAFPLTLTFSSCQEGRDAGDLLGQWRMADSDSKYISFSGSITEFRYVEGGALRQNVFGNFQHVGDSLFIQCYSINEEQKATDTELIEDTYEMKPFNDIRVKIEVLDSKHLSLSKNGKMWNFYKY